MKVLFKEEIIVKTEKFTVWQDREVPIPGFFILAPNRDLRSIDEFSKGELEEFTEILVKIRKWMRNVLGIKDVYLFQNEDTDGSFHLRIFPRHDWMEKFWRKIQSVRPIMEWAIENMVKDEIFKEVKEYVQKMKEFFENS